MANGKPACNHWAQFKCNYGDNCNFSHDGPGGPGPGAPPGPAMRQKKSDICQHWMQGRCNYGSSCSFSHAGPGGMGSGRQGTMMTQQVGGYGPAARMQGNKQAISIAQQALSTMGIDLNSLLAVAGIHSGGMMQQNMGMMGMGMGGGAGMMGQKTKVCSHWREGKCEYGDNCRFAHTGPGGCTERGQQQMASAQAEFEDQGDPSQRPCTHWTMYKCEYGDSCRFSHDGPGGPSGGAMGAGGGRSATQSGSKQDRPCMHWAQHKCNYGDRCQFSHDGPGGPSPEGEFFQASKPQRFAPFDESFIFEAFREVSDRPSDPQQPSCMLLHYVPPPFVCECNASKNWHAACEPLAACQKWSGTSGVICRA
eukprot:CAMPEP_0206592784 /NCGR_PEP_ID=MMETSP0325_2-20121206/41197_1 /ASSEMBLY_ACC=CAM_ASM_000347 /TAXON_ID=2866 /ORGANISM="Crypthecodinium cohnii, Strain Seligo" /LENGTH=364 /DNA_ID=CAMNT_0054102545 /DNA_START=8 /DNA_END=1099 /DNA_ORIENTATION=-